MSKVVAQLHEVLSDHLAQIAKLFKHPAKLTLVVRTPDAEGDTSVVIGDDDYELAIAEIRHRMKATGFIIDPAVDTLVERYKIARAEAEANLFRGVARAELYRSCRYCGEFWQQWQGLKLDGHAKCMVPAWFKEELRATLAKRSVLRYADIATALGVSVAVIRSWVAT